MEEIIMLTPQDVRSVQFEKNLRGYRTEDVDRFLDKVEQQLGQDAEQMEALRKQVADLTAENETLRRNMQSYEADGDMLKSALINAQRMGENVIREANQKAEDILHRANLRGDDIIRGTYSMTGPISAANCACAISASFCPKKIICGCTPRRIFARFFPNGRAVRIRAITAALRF